MSRGTRRQDAFLVDVDGQDFLRTPAEARLQQLWLLPDRAAAPAGVDASGSTRGRETELNLLFACSQVLSAARGNARLLGRSLRAFVLEKRLPRLSSID